MDLWIKYKEKKPELNSLILALIEGHPWKYWIGYYIPEYYMDAYYGDLGEILYWLPIPECPEDEENDENQSS